MVAVDINIFDFLDYRDFLQAHYTKSKEKNSIISFRYIANKTGLDASFYVKVLQKQKHIADSAITTLADFFRFNKRERKYFTCLVAFNKAKKNDQINFYFKELLQLRDPVAKTLDKAKYDYFSQWYNIAIRELLNFYRFKGEPAELAERLVPQISARDAKSAIELLQKLELVKKGPDGTYAPTDSFLTSGESLRSIAVRNFQKQVCQLAMEAIDRIEPQKRDISTLTVSTSQATLMAIRERLSEVRKEIMEMVRNEPEVENVYQINFQIFPLTDCRETQTK